MGLGSLCKRAVPPALKPFAKAVYYRAFRGWLQLAFWFLDHAAPQPREGGPIPPAKLRYRVSETLSAREFLRIGQGCAHLIRSHVELMGMKIDSARRVLDFGCGCGRTVRWFLGEKSNTEFYGVDVDAEAIDWCSQHHPAARFSANRPNPPLPYPGGYFDVVYCVSVFTHLNEAMQNLWLQELNRILRPGGILLLTVYAKAVTQSLNEESRQELQQSGFVHARSKKLKGLVPDWYQTSWHSPEYIRARLSAGFTDIQYSEVPGGLQDVVVARKRS